MRSTMVNNASHCCASQLSSGVHGLAMGDREVCAICQHTLISTGKQQSRFCKVRCDNCVECVMGLRLPGQVEAVAVWQLPLMWSVKPKDHRAEGQA